MDEKRRRILKLLEEGHVTAEEADQLLEALNDANNSENNQSKAETIADKESEAEDFTKNLKKDLKNLTEGLFNMVDDTLQKVKSGPFEFNFKHTSVKREFQFDSSDITNLSLNLASSSIEIFPSENDEISMDCRGKVYKETNQEEAEKKFDQSFQVSVNDQTLHIEQDRKYIMVEITLYLPKKIYHDVSIKTINGSIYLRNHHFEAARISTVNGSVKANKFKSEALYVDTKHGSVRLDDVQLSKAKIDTTTGAAFIDGEIGHLKTNVITGSIRAYVRNSDAGDADLHATTGSIQLYVPEDIRLHGHASTTVSSVDINLPDANVDTESDQIMKKFIRFNKGIDKDSEETDYFDVDLSTKTGSIRVSNL
ncbi:hypothetical protein CEY16_08795 [Halalkalibacillus sediminis]|uniref:Uncharacterized protein n=1 Tax=Halalkalibacillus sediminis TaxID=2018042 RepID=A0A2I0QUM4_9BACI|nr:DUF4097 family beta strand repeat-containing protein [Halalkalibacillus sediminis]PKR78008.1 hypothetical protein CEY16_08795 [Halalkalibacillus sediminis]